MCGIVGVIGARPAAPIILDALRRLEYRGYDSAGIATLVLAGVHPSAHMCSLIPTRPAPNHVGRPSLGEVKPVVPRLRQRDGVSCGPTVAVVAGALLDPDYRGREISERSLTHILMKSAGE